MNYQEMYNSKLGTVDGALSKIKSGDSIAVPFYCNEPRLFLKSLHLIAPHVKNVTLWCARTMDDYEVMKDNSFFVSLSFNSFEIPCASVSSSPKNTFVKLFPIIALPILSGAFNTSSICWVDTVQSALYFLKRL